MDSEELAELIDTDSPYYEHFILDLGSDRGAAWICGNCGQEVPDNRQGCPDHAPRDVPGLLRAECEATPPHSPVWTFNGDHAGYGNPCPQCIIDRLAADHAKATKQDRCYHRPWRRWKIAHKVAGWGYALGLFSTGGGFSWGGGHEHCLSLPHLRGQRVYILGVSRDTWRCWLVGRHRRGQHVGFGMCGKCQPWTCCGAETVEHADGCPEEIRAVTT